MTNRRKITIPALLLVFVLIVDRLVKWWTLQNLVPIGNPGRESIPGLFKLIYVENRGVACGLFPNNSLFFAVLSTLIIVGIIWRSWGWFWRTDVLARCSAALIVAGGMGNIIGVVAQRLVRVLCPQCKEPVKPTDEERKILGVKRNEAIQIYKHKGCKRCNQTGYRGRMAILELLRIDSEMDSLIARRAHLDELRKMALDKGFTTLADDGVRRILEGYTSIEEVMRVIDLTARLTQ